MNGPNDSSTARVRDTVSTSTPASQALATDVVDEIQSVVQPPKGVVDRPPGEELPRLSKPGGTLARNLPDWDLEPPAFLVRRGEEA